MAGARLPLDVLSTNFVLGFGPGRSCGGCSACCTALGVPELGKPQLCDCVHQTAAGCAAYENRPDVCRGYSCLWLQGWGDEDDRPDKTGVLPTLDQWSGLAPYSVDLIELRPGAVEAHFGPDLAELLRVLPLGWILTVVPHGVSRAWDFPVADEYRPRSPRPGSNLLVRLRGPAPVYRQLGVQAPARKVV